MKSKYFKIICLSAGLSTLFVSSCKKFVEIDPAVDKIETKLAYATDDLVRANIAGLHSNNFVPGFFFNAYIPAYIALSADEMTYNGTYFDEFINNEIKDTNGENGSFWSDLYQMISQSNLMLEELDKSKTISAPVKAEAYGTAKFFRAYAYLYLVSLYGDVPLVLSTNIATGISLPRAPKAQVYAQIIADLLEAKTALKGLNKPNTVVSEKSATAILARAYLYNKQWQNAADAATELISGPLKGTLMLEDIQKKFLRTSQETILAISTATGYFVNYTYAGALFAPTTSTTYNLTKNLVDSFEAGDLRKTNWVGTFTNSSGLTTNYPLKYKLGGAPSNATLGEDAVLIRLSEMVLIRAEALAQLGRPSDAVDDINAIRTKAGLTNLPKTLTKEDALLAVEKERRTEFFSEGQRWFDLVRTGRADAVLGAFKPGKWKSTAALYPIPAKEINLNPNLNPQNPGYGK